MGHSNMKLHKKVEDEVMDMPEKKENEISRCQRNKIQAKSLEESEIFPRHKARGGQQNVSRA